MNARRRMIQRLCATGTAVFALLAAGCMVPPHPADPESESGQVTAAYFAAPVVHLYPVNAYGARIPEHAWKETVATIQRHLGRPVESHKPIDLFPPGTSGAEPPGADDRLAIQSLVTIWQEDAKRPPGVVVIHSHIPFIRGVSVEEGGGLLPITDRDAIFVIALKTDGGGSLTGFTCPAAHLNADGSVERTTGGAMVFPSAIQATSNLFISEEKLWQWTLTHEIGHVLGVPADKSHAWNVQRLGRHCTRPECVMYTGVDWRVVLSGLLHGWPLDFCDECRREMEAARLAQCPPTNAPTDP